MGNQVQFHDLSPHNTHTMRVCVSCPSHHQQQRQQQQHWIIFRDEFQLGKKSKIFFVFVLQRGPVGPRGPAGSPGAAGVPGVDGIDVSRRFVPFNSHRFQFSDVGQSCGSVHFWVNRLSEQWSRFSVVYTEDSRTAEQQNNIHPDYVQWCYTFNEWENSCSLALDM